MHPKAQVGGGGLACTPDRLLLVGVLQPERFQHYLLSNANRNVVSTLSLSKLGRCWFHRLNTFNGDLAVLCPNLCYECVFVLSCR